MKEAEAVALHVKTVTRGLRGLLEPLGYTLFKTNEQLDEIVQFRWRQSVEWKSLEVRLWYHKRHPTRLQVGFSVCVPDEERNDERYFDGRDLDYLVGRSKPYYMPSFFARVVGRSTSRYARKICFDTTKALKWFELFDSPEKCLVQLRAGETNGAGAPGGGPHPWFESYFTQLLGSAPSEADNT